MNRTGIILFTAICCFIALSCSLKKEDTVVNFWAMGAEGEYVTQLIPDFEQRNPGIKIKVQMIPWTAAQEKLITAFASDNMPDACQLGNTWIPQFAALKAIIPLNELVQNSSVINRSNYFDGIWNTNLIDTSLYGIPWYIDTRVLFYRTDVLRKAGYNSAPRSWDELYDVSKKIKQNFGNVEKYPIYLPTNEWAPFILFGLQAGSTILKDNNCYSDFSGKEFRKAFEYLLKFHKEKLAPIGFTQVTNIYQAFAEEYICMYISGPWNINEFKKWMKNDLKDKWMTAPLPGIDGTYPGISLAGGSSLVIFEKSEKKAAVWKFIEYLSEPRTQLAFYNLVNDLPAVKEAWEDSTLKRDPYIKAFYEQFHSVMATPKIPEWEQIAFSKVQQYAEISARGAMSVSKTLETLDEDVNKILEKRRWLLSKE